MHERVSSASAPIRILNYIRLVVALTVFLVSLLAMFPAPTNWTWEISVGVTESGHVLALVAMLVFFPGWTRTTSGRLSALIGVVAILLALSPLIRARAVAAALPAQLNSAFGGRNPGQGANAVPRPDALVYRNLITGVYSPAIRIDTVTYATRDGYGLGMDLYRPESSPGRPLPLVVVIHGGAWRGGSRRESSDLNRYLAARGYAMAAVSYRMAPAYPHPAASMDVHDAIQFLKRNAPRLEVDATRIALIGRSSGGQLALLEAYTSSDPAIRGVVAFYAPSDLVFAHENPSNARIFNSTLALEDYLAGNPRTKPDAYRTASPINFVGGSTVPTLLIHGNKDELVSVRQSERLDNKLAAANRPHFFLRLPWATHGCDFSFDGPCGQISTYAIEVFLGDVMR